MTHTQPPTTATPPTAATPPARDARPNWLVIAVALLAFVLPLLTPGCASDGDLRRAVAAAKNKQADIATDIDTSAAQLATATKQRDDLTATVATLERTAADPTVDTATRATAAERAAVARVQLADSSASIAALNAQLTTARASFADLKSAITEAESTLTTVTDDAANYGAIAHIADAALPVGGIGGLLVLALQNFKRGRAVTRLQRAGVGVVSSIQWLADAEPAVSEAIAKNADTLRVKQGREGNVLVDQVQGKTPPIAADAVL